MTRFVIVSFLPDNINKILEPVRDHFEPGVNAQIPPHISLTYPFFWKAEKNELVREMEKETRNFSPFLAIISGIGVFFNPSHSGGVKGKQVIYAQVLPEEPFREIHKSFEKALTGNVKFDTSQFPQKTLPSFIPHITLVMNGVEKDLKTAQKMISSVIGYSFMVENVWLLKKEEGSEKWEKVKEITF